VAGAIIAGGTGAVLGSTIGKGSGWDAAMISGAILGMLSGYSIGQSLDQGDLACTGYALQRALMGRPSGGKIPIRNTAIMLCRPTVGRTPTDAIATNIVQRPILAENCGKHMAPPAAKQMVPGRSCRRDRSPSNQI